MRVIAQASINAGRLTADCGFEPVSAETQLVSERLPIQISDIENSLGRDSPPAFAAFGANPPKFYARDRVHGR